MDDTAFVAAAAVASALITLVSSLLKPKARAIELKAEGDTNVRIKEAEIESEAFKTINDLLKKASSQNSELQQALLTQNNAVAHFLEKQTALIEILIERLERSFPHDPV